MEVEYAGKLVEDQLNGRPVKNQSSISSTRAFVTQSGNIHDYNLRAYVCFVG
jgi:hypothetical protein